MGQEGAFERHQPKRGGSAVKVTTLGIDLAKNNFRVHGVDARGKTVLSKSLSRRQLSIFMAQLAPCLVGMETCPISNHWARGLEKFGHQVRLMAPRFVRAYVKANKNDTADVEAIGEEVRWPSMRFVAVKSAVQQDVQAVHRVRAQLVKTRIALANQVRGLLGEYGIVIGKGFAPLRRALPTVLENRDQRLSGLLLELIAEMSEQLKLLEQRLHEYDLRVRRLLRADERCLRLAEVPGIGELTATALVATVGNAREFKSGRELAAYLGLVPRHRASGGRTVMLGISKHGDTYLRTLLIHGARAALCINSRWRGAHGAWAEGLKVRRGPNIAAVALANKNARVAWKLLSTGERYRPLPPRPNESQDTGTRAPRAPLRQPTGRRGELRVVADPNLAAFRPPSNSVRGRAENPL